MPDYVPKNIITRSLGPSDNAEIDLEGPFPLQAGDTFLLCTDGLSGPVRDEEMGTIIACLPPDNAVRALVDLANLRGGPDNITVIVARVTAAPVLPATDPTEISARLESPAQAAAILAALAETRIDVAGFAVGSPSLDEVFLALTGRPAEETRTEAAP